MKNSCNPRDGHDPSAEKEEFHKVQMEQFAIQAEEKMVKRRNLYIQEAGEELRRREDSHFAVPFPRGLRLFLHVVRFGVRRFEQSVPHRRG